ncbi:MAG: hypothetical protein J6S51_04965 [Kiritimatiellae bacterium]|nr:hypothetical protein [Kiritimatiellia bacterium]
MKTKLCATFVLGAFAMLAYAGQNDAQKYDPAMATKTAVITNDVKWLDGKYLPLEGGYYSEKFGRYERVPGNITTNVNRGVRGQRQHTSGMMFRFKTTSKKLHFNWVPVNKTLGMDHMPASGVSGIDVYKWNKSKSSWQYVKTGRIYHHAAGKLSLDWNPDDICLVNLPLYNGVKSFKIGVEKDAAITEAGTRSSGVTKPVLFYGTSITHGGCASRPGLGFVNIVGRKLDVPVVGLGFSGSGVMELEMADVVSRIEASCYVLDCIWNMSFDETGKDIRSVQRNYEPFIRSLRAKHPSVPIVMAGACDVYCGTAASSKSIMAREQFAKELFMKLKKEGWENLYFLPGKGMLGDDFEGTVDGVHPNDIGMMRMSEFYAKAVAEALKLKGSK